MRSALIVIVILLSCAPALKSQDDGFPPCSAAELRFVMGLQPGFERLLELLLADGEVGDLARGFSVALIYWRAELWTSLPPCADALETVALLSETTSDIAATAVLIHGGVATSENPYVMRQTDDSKPYDRVREQFASITALLATGERPEDPAPGERSLPECGGAELEAMLEALRDREDIVVAGSQAATLPLLLEYIPAMLAWRAGLWDQMMPCADAVHLGMMLSETASDIVPAFGLSFVGVPIEENPYFELLLERIDELDERVEALVALSRGAKKAQAAAPVAVALPACSADEMAAAAKQLEPLGGLIREASGFDSLQEDLLVYVSEMIDWRDALWSEIPLCAEAFEISLIATNAASDFASMFTLALAGKGIDVRSYRELSLKGLSAATAWMAEKRAGGDASQATAQVDSLPPCSDEAREALTANMEQVELFAWMVTNFETVDDVLTYGEVQVAWREQIWKKFPPCQEAIEAGRLLIQLTGDAVPVSALHLFADVEAEYIPYLDVISRARERIEAIAAAFGNG